MPPLISANRAKQLRRTLRNLRLTTLCLLLTVLVLRSTIGAGRFWTPAQDFQEIKHHLRVRRSWHGRRPLYEAALLDNPSADDASTAEPVAVKVGYGDAKRLLSLCLAAARWNLYAEDVRLLLGSQNRQNEVGMHVRGAEEAAGAVAVDFLQKKRMTPTSGGNSLVEVPEIWRTTSSDRVMMEYMKRLLQQQSGHGSTTLPAPRHHVCKR